MGVMMSAVVCCCVGWGFFGVGVGASKRGFGGFWVVCFVGMGKTKEKRLAGGREGGLPVFWRALPMYGFFLSCGSQPVRMVGRIAGIFCLCMLGWLPELMMEMEICCKRTRRIYHTQIVFAVNIHRILRRMA
ncbi:uncharacterized protein B0H64DRAFT_392858 [Chaetomium fimeti]|uniref:Secreted protein n=1 Tax=Chaetomium fimeti TaxID=1854472 RepID=A0AAE0LU82_9PEZI|nr:hypothetical protein B0H64DRAFT_392858 [Chaetomium fimeti]